MGLHQGLPEAELVATSEQAARALLALQPDNPRSSFATGEAAAMANATDSSASLVRDPLPHFRRGAELARAQSSDFWLARWAGVGPGASCGQLRWGVGSKLRG